MSDHPHSAPYCDKGNVMPGRVTVTGGVLGQMVRSRPGRRFSASHTLAVLIVPQ